MNVKDQVLSIAQVQELQELGFDVNKYASVEVNITEKGNKFIISKEFIKLFPKFGDDSVIQRYSTMTIGDIINILPTEIDEFVLNMNRRYVSYDSRTTNLFYAYRCKFIDSLFDCLVWCIKQKHIEL